MNNNNKKKVRDLTKLRKERLLKNDEIKKLKKKFKELFKMKDVNGKKLMEISEFCKLIKNAREDPNWDESLNPLLCKYDDCKKCPYYLKDIKEKISLKLGRKNE